MRTSKSTIFLVLFMLSTNCVFAQYNLEWNFTNPGASNGAIHNNMFCHSNGDVFVSGYNAGGDLDPGPGSNYSGTFDGNNFMARYTNTGNLVYARPRFYSAPPGSHSLYCDFADDDGNYFFAFGGNNGIYVLDTLTGSGSGQITMTTLSKAVVKIDAYGVFVNAISYPSNITIWGIRTLPDKSILIAGEVEGNPDFDPGAGVFTANPTAGYEHAFVVKFDSVFNFIDAKLFQSLGGNYPEGFRFNSLEVDHSGNVLFGGYFIGSVDLDPGPGQLLQYWTPPISQPWSISDGLPFVVKLNSTLDFDTAYTFSWKLNFQPLCDPFNNIYFFGICEGNIDVDPSAGVTVINNSTANDVFYISKYDSLFNLKWVKSTQNNDFNVNSLKFSANESIDMVIQISDTLGANGFGLPPLTGQFTNNWLSSSYLVSLDTSGTAIHSVLLGATGQLLNVAAAYSNANNFYFAGRVSDTIDIEIGPGITLQGPAPGNANNFFLSYYSTDPYISQIRGNAYIDQNGNNTKDANEGGAQGLIVAIDPGNYFISTGSSGDFGAYVTPNNYNITIPTVPLNYLPPQPSVHTANFTTGNQLDTANNFALQLDLTRQDLRVTLTNVAGTRPGFPLNYNLTVKNIGGNSQSGSVSLDLDNKLTFLSSSTAPDNITGDTLTWSFVNLMPLQSLNYNILTHVDSLASIGDSVLSTTQLLPLIGDVDTTNNFDESLSMVTGSYDPNDKASVPDNAVPIAFMQNGQFIEYTIRFQNLGNDTAFNVIILDTLSNHLDIGSLDIVACSHNYNFNLYPTRLLEIKMPNIFLPDSGVNEVESNGFIKYRIRIKNNLNLGDIVYNTAHIYFDYNQPVATNTTALEVVQFTNLNEFADATNEINVYPNPSSGITTILFNNQENFSGKIEVADMSGRVVMNIPSFTGNKVQLNLNHLGSGIYLVKTELKTGIKYFSKIILTNDEE